MKCKKSIVLSVISIALLTSPAVFLASCSSNSNVNEVTIEKKQTNLNEIYKINKSSFLKLLNEFPFLIENNILKLNHFPNLTTIEDNTFEATNDFIFNGQPIRFDKIVFNDKLTSIGKNAFKNLNSLTIVKLPNSITNIGQNAFDNAFNENNAKIEFNEHHQSTITFGNNSFANNKSLIIYVVNNTALETRINDIKNQIGYIDSVIDQNDTQGGTIDGLNVDKYLTLISLLDLTPSTKLSTLTNEILNNKLKNNNNIPNTSPYKKVTFEIQDESSEQTGKLLLKINLNNSSTTPATEPIIVTINGFNVFQPTNLRISSFEINKDEFFENMQTENNISSWQLNDWNKYIKKINLSDEKQSGSIVNYDLKNSEQKIVTINNFNYSKNNNKNKISLNATINYKKYSNNGWQLIDNSNSTLTINGSGNKPFEFELPNNKSDLFSFLDKKIAIKNNVSLNDKYPSFYLSQQRYNIKTWANSLFGIPDNFNEYIKKFNIKKLSINAETVKPNDVDGTLGFIYNLKDEENDSSFIFQSSKTFSGFKQLANPLDEKVVLNTTKQAENDSIYKRIIKYLKPINLENQQSVQVDNYGFLGYGKTTTNNNNKIKLIDEVEIDENQRETNLKNLIAKYNIDNGSIFKNISFHTNVFNPKTNLFNDSYIINRLSIDTDVSQKATFQKSSETIYHYMIPITVSLDINQNSLSDYNEHTFSSTGTLSFIINKSDLSK